MDGERFVGLVRVSTAMQGESRLGLEAGLADLHGYVALRGGTLITVLEEVQSGTHDDLVDRPTLVKALTLCKRHRAFLLVPKVDRLVRSTIAHSEIKRSGVPFRAVDNEAANEFTIDVMVAVAAQEARAIADRVRKSLAAYKAGKRVSKRIRALYPEGVPADVVEATAGKLGSHLVGCLLTEEGRDKGRVKGNAKQAREAVDVYADLVDDVRRLRTEGASLGTIAERMNADGHTTRTGAAWSRVQVKRLLDRIGPSR
jgi:DNA invertase Pin-like site-specific DNA recombinase